MRGNTNKIIKLVADSWNPWVGCSVKSEGCFNCYGPSLARRLERNGASVYAGTYRERSSTIHWTGKINHVANKIFYRPRSITTPSLISVCSMSDFFHESVPDSHRLHALEVMHEIDRHRYLITTRRPELIVPFLRRNGVSLPETVWLGTSVESVKYSHRIGVLRSVPAFLRVAVFEPLIADIGDIDLSGFDLVLSGGESGSRARRLLPEWVESIDAQCRRDGVPHRFAGWGMPQHNPLYKEALSLKVNPTVYVLSRDSMGMGGSMINGNYIDGNPRGFDIQWTK